MTLYRHGMIFSTFLGCCLTVGLLATSLGTNHWLTARAVRPTFAKSDGQVNFGLFRGEKNLTVGIGWRSQRFQVPTDVEGMEWWMWMGTVICLCLGLLASSIGALFAVINTATSPSSQLSGIPGLYLWNALAILFQGSGVGLWSWLYYKSLQHNVMSAEDRADLMWTTEGKATFGFSFWLVVASVIIHFSNILFILSGTREERVKKKALTPIIEEKGNGAIMLY